MSEWRERSLPVESAVMRPGEAAYVVRISIPIMPGHNFIASSEAILGCPFEFVRVERDTQLDKRVVLLAASVRDQWAVRPPGSDWPLADRAVLGPGEVLAMWFKNFSDKPQAFRGLLVGRERVPG